MAPLLLRPSLQYKWNDDRDPGCSSTKLSASKARRSLVTSTSFPNVVLPQPCLPNSIHPQPGLPGRPAVQAAIISPMFEEQHPIVSTEVESGLALASGSGSVRSCQSPSNLQRETLSLLRQIIPLSTWNEIVEGCTRSRLAYERLYEMAIRRQIKGIRLEVNKQEWIAAWTDKDRRERRKYFSIRQQGREQAWYMAVKTRAEALNDGARIRWGTSRRRPA